MAWIFTLFVFALCAVLLFAGSRITHIPSFHKALRDHESGKQKIPKIVLMFLAWLWPFQRVNAEHAFKAFGDKRMTRLYHIAGWIYIVMAIFTIVMMVLIHLGVV